MLDQAVDDGRGQARDLGQQAVAARRDRGVEVLRTAEADDPRDGGGVDEVGRGEALELGEVQLGAGRAALAGGQVVADDELALGVDAGDELLELEREQPAVGAELEHVVLDLARDPDDHLEPLRHHGDVAHGDQVLDLEGGQRRRHLVETELVALERGQCLVGTRQDLAGVLQHVADVADVGRDDLHRLADRDHRVTGLLRDPLGRTVPGAGLLRRDRVVGHQVDRGAVDAGEVLVDDDRAVHLRQLAQSGGGEGHVEGEPAGRDRVDRLVLAQHDQGAGATAQDPLEAVAQRRTGRDGRQGRAQAQLLVDALGHRSSTSVCAGTPSGTPGEV